jgi:hypothetical protein
MAAIREMRAAASFRCSYLAARRPYVFYKTSPVCGFLCGSARVWQRQAECQQAFAEGAHPFVLIRTVAMLWSSSAAAYGYKYPIFDKPLA